MHAWIRRATRASLVVAAALGMAVSCETETTKRFGDPCADDTDCTSGVCYGSTCGRFGVACVFGSPSAEVECDDGDACTSDACAESNRCVHTKVPSCAAGTSCKCADPGATIDPGDCTWEDAAACSGWHSVLMANDYEGDPELPDGTELCAMGCCLTLVCP